MAIAFDSSSVASTTGSASFTVAHTCTGTNRALVVSVSCPNSSNYLAAATVTYAGTSMGAARVSATAYGSLFVYTWVLANPAAGTNNVVVTPSSTAYMDVVISSFTGVDQTTPVTATAQAGSGFATSPFSTNITVGAGGVAVDAFSMRTTAGTLAFHASQTAASAETNNGVGRTRASYKAGATAMEWTFSASQPAVSYTVVALAEAAGGGGPTYTLALDPAAFTLTGQSVDLTYTPNVPALTFSSTHALRLKGSGTLLASRSDLKIDVIETGAAPRAVVVSLDGHTTNASGIPAAIADAALTEGDTYTVVGRIAATVEGQVEPGFRFDMVAS